MTKFVRQSLLCSALALAAGMPALNAQAAALRWAAQNDIQTLDPHSQNHATTNTIGGLAYEGLTRYNEKFQPEPALASKWTQISPTQVRFELRRGVKFHDGTPFTADDVLFSFGRVRQPQANLQIFVSGIKEIKKIDDYTVDLLLDGPNPILLRNLVYFRIMSKSWAEKNKATNTQDFKAKEDTYASRNAMGTGPYKVTGWQPDQKITLVANKDWWDTNKGNVSEISYLPIKSDATRVAALLSGELDLLTDLPTQDVAKLRTDPKLKVLDGNENRTIFIAMDQGSEELKGSNIKGKNPFKDKRVREALNLAIDREAIKRSLMRGLSVPAAIMVAPGVHGHTADIDMAPKQDVDKAKKLLAEAGYPSGFEVPLNCPNDRYVNDEEICQAVVVMWSKIGVKAKLATSPMSQHSQLLQRLDSPLYLYGWGVVTFDAQYTLQDVVHTKTTGADGKGNFSRLSDAKLDALVQAMKVEVNVAKRDAQMREALLRVRDEFFFIPIHHQVRPWAMRSNVETPHRADDRPEPRWTSLR
ncbi:peptide/nickel transport system substrate-binding protein [Paucibacter oligotrophus]|uniref:Peptide/nickel transport system substrate-binding protein n=1 Tax=Roseateles oligotrophus TaxID=1769250 RepID=A0A840L6A4_9BURK|nr:ABC transporter substrate-binding protein [Roseateles oligotrophus]MBB4842135.1 peptide/nickel transport system substrate-binding protein [Roseateles oligotrophus]